MASSSGRLDRSRRVGALVTIRDDPKGDDPGINEGKKGLPVLLHA